MHARAWSVVIEKRPIIAQWRRRLRPLFLVVALGALAWTIWLLRDALPTLLNVLPSMSWSWLVIALLANATSAYLAFEAFFALFGRVCPIGYRRPQLAHLYFTGQVMKHLPGRVWGLAYQASVGGNAGWSEWLSTTVAFSLLNAAFACWLGAVVIGFRSHWYFGVLALFVGIFAYAVGWSPRWVAVVGGVIRKLSLRSAAPFLDAIEQLSGVTTRFKWVVWCLFAASWLVYLLAWVGYAAAWPGITSMDGVWLCALYTVAWLAGYLSLVTPSGLGVRELTFAWLAKDFPDDAVLLMAIVGRVALLFVDLALGLVFAPFVPHRGKSS